MASKNCEGGRGGEGQGKGEEGEESGKGGERNRRGGYGWETGEREGEGSGERQE